jgi:Baseplate J-like protein
MSCGCADCASGSDARTLVRTGTTRPQRARPALDTTRLPVDGRRAEHAMAFAAAYARHLPFVDADGAAAGTWETFFTSDTAAQLAAAAIEDVAEYRTTVQEHLRQLTDPELPASSPLLVAALGAVFDCVGTLARRLDELREGLPNDEPLRASLTNLIRARLSAPLRQLIGFYRAGVALGVVDPAAAPPATPLILGRPIVSFGSLVAGPGLSSDWPEGMGASGWGSYVGVDLTEPTAAYGSGASDADRANHLATHNLFRAAGEAFLAGYARVVVDAGAALRASFAGGSHEPHYALFLAFLQLFDYARDEVNTLAGQHLDFYYRRVLRLAERPAQPSQAHVLAELAKHVDSHLLPAGTRLKAGRDLRFGLDRDLVANRAVVDELRSLYRHHNLVDAETLKYADGRIFADLAANAGETWSPFAKKTYVDGQLRSIDMPPAEVGFAVASHHLWLAEGTRTITLQVGTPPPLDVFTIGSEPVYLRCRLTTAKGWLEKPVERVARGVDGMAFRLVLDANDPPVTPYRAATHGYALDTDQPVLLVTLPHPEQALWSYRLLADTLVRSLILTTKVDGIRTLALANGQGPIDASKPFLAFGSAPTSNSALVIGSKEAFQKSPTAVRLDAELTAAPVAHSTSTSDPPPAISVDCLNAGSWLSLPGARLMFLTTLAAPQRITLTCALPSFAQPAVITPDLTPDIPYSTTSRGGFIRLRLDRGYGTDTYPVALAAWVAQRSPDPPPTAPVLPRFSSLVLGYDATQKINLTTPAEATGRFFHITPFGHAEQRGTRGPLLPQFRAGPTEDSDGELYLGVSGLRPPQNLALLFQVADGTANPLALKPERHLRWSYLRGNEWAPFRDDAVGDLTDGLLASGIVTLAVPTDASTEHTLMPRGRRWVRIAVATGIDAVCRLVGVAAQGALATATAPPGPGAPTVALPAGTISKLDPPDPPVKSVRQPYPTFGGRPVEDAKTFATRVSERLRHKDRAITLWDYEHLVLEAFPGLYQARVLNHTRYEPTTCAAGDYSELAPGHVTVVTIPDLAVPNPRDPLRPFTSLRVLGEVKRFLQPRMSCFAHLHVGNPQFEEVKVDLRVRLRDGYDETFHVNRLRQELTELLSPWAFRPDARPVFNGTVYRSALVDFVEERLYVDYVTDVELSRRLPGAAAYAVAGETVVGSRAISILVSAPAAEHGVEVIHTSSTGPAEDCGCPPVVP